MRQLKRHGGGAMMDRALAGFAALPPPPPSCWEVLGVRPGTNPTGVEQAYRAKAVKLHPDRGGSDKAMAELNAARDQALQDG
jgi:DnaJ-class molecular chaperone